MAGLVRKTSRQFGVSGPTSSFGQFGSKQAGSPQTSQDPTVIQQLSAWVEGWQDAVVSGDKAAYIEDMNGFCFVDSYQLTYLFQMGIPEWDSSTLYFTNSVVQTQTNGQWFRSLQGGVPGSGAGQSGNTPPASSSNAFWLWINPPQDLVGSATLNTLQKVTSTSPSNGVPGSVVLGDSLLSETGGNVKIASGGFQFADNTVQTTAAVSSNAVAAQSPPSAFDTAHTSPASGTRLIGTTYQNTGSKPRFVSVTVQTFDVSTSVAKVGSTSAFTAGTFGSITSSQGAATPTSLYAQLFFIVLPGYYYLVSGGTLADPTSWIEWT